MKEKKFLKDLQRVFEKHGMHLEADVYEGYIYVKEGVEGQDIAANTEYHRQRQLEAERRARECKAMRRRWKACTHAFPLTPEYPSFSSIGRYERYVCVKCGYVKQVKDGKILNWDWDEYG